MQELAATLGSPRGHDEQATYVVVPSEASSAALAGSTPASPPPDGSTPSCASPSWTEAQVRRLHSKFEVGARDECWPWRGGVNKDGYGLFTFRFDGRTRNMPAHRAVFFLLGGCRYEAWGVHGEHSSAMTSKGDAEVMYPLKVARSLDTTGGYATNQGGTLISSRDLPEQAALHHLCANKLCVNPAHLQPISRADHAALHHPRPDICPRGHAYDEANTYIDTKGGRRCRTCHRERMRTTRTDPSTDPCSAGSGGSTVDSTDPVGDRPSSVKAMSGDVPCSEHGSPGCRCTTTYEMWDAFNHQTTGDKVRSLRRSTGGGLHDTLLISSSAGSPARTCPSPDNDADSPAADPASSTSSPASPTLFDLDGYSSRTYPDCSPAMAVGTSESCLERWPTSGTAWVGGFSTAVTSECRSDDDGCSSSEPSLTEILEPPQSVPAKYSLSGRAARGILRRAEKRGRTLPGYLATALESVAGHRTPNG